MFFIINKMPLRQIFINFHKKDDNDIDIDDYNFSEKYIFMVEGYSLISNIGFVKIEIGCGNCMNDSIFFAYDRIKNNLLINYNIVVNEMKILDYNLYNKITNTKTSGFVFYPLTNDVIQEFREDEERYFMSLEDK